MEVSRCCLPWSVQCRAGDNPKGFLLDLCVRMLVCVRACVFNSVFPVLSCIFLCCLLLDSPPLCFSSLNNTSVRCSLRTRARKEEIDVGTPREAEKKGSRHGEREGKKASFERLLTSKLTVIVVLARGESTFKHTGWVTMWRDYKSKVIHNKQHSLGSALPANLHEIGGEKKIASAQKVSKGLA